MSDLVAPSGAVHWVGTGLSTGSGLRLLCDGTSSVTLWGRTEEKAARCLAGLGLADRATARAFGLDALADAVAPGDVVVSMLPATQHAAVVRLCLAGQAHFACSSYTSDELATAGPAAAAAGLVLLTEAGLDPGIDHILAHSLVNAARVELGEGPAKVWFTSYCGGVPAVPNEFRYRFSWAPRGVLTALCSPARSIESGQIRDVRYPWEATRSHELDGETFEVYPNRDSVPFLRQYHLPEAWQPHTFVRGTLRLDGWREAWTEVFDVLRGGDPGQIDTLAADLLSRYAMGPHDRDRVVLAVDLTVVGDGGARWSGRYLLDLVGDAEETAMARSVSLPLAHAVLEIVAGATPPGLHRALPDPAGAETFIAAIRGYGLDCVLTR
ncbi:MAG TPA: saccharopine dehydrogenase C-terminal domain-containing protein [Micromonosporaceae bacterium]